MNQIKLLTEGKSNARTVTLFSHHCKDEKALIKATLKALKTIKQ